MTSLMEYLALLAECVKYLAVSNGSKFLIAIVVGLALGVAGYWICSASSKLWNRSYHLRVGHHAMCAFAAFVTVLFTLVYVSADYMGEVAKAEIHGWQDQVSEDSDFQHELFVRAFDGVSKSGIEDMTGVGNPRVDSSVTIPINKWESRILVARIYSEGALQNFADRHPYLDSSLDPGTSVPEDEIKQDLVNFFKGDPTAKMYPTERAVIIATSYLQSLAEEQLPGIESYTRRITLALFVVVQLFVFAMISLAAHRSLTATV